MESELCKELISMMHKIQANMDNDFKKMQQRRFNFFNKYITSSVASNKQRLQQHQDLDTTMPPLKHLFKAFFLEKNLV
eukprot:5308510-Ditylum_brightwellii.AAC.1